MQNVQKSQNVVFKIENPTQDIVLFKPSRDTISSANKTKGVEK